MIKLLGIEVELGSYEPIELMTHVRDAYVERFGAEPEDPGGWYEDYAWRRISYVFERLDKGGDVLDVGSGAGQFANCLAISGEFKSVATTDPTRFNKYFELSNGIVRYDNGIDRLPFPDDSFDVVTCMEVLEHLPDEVFAKAIPELRRVCRGQLVITVPYCEPFPISPSHVRRFEDPDFARLFPNADFALLRRPNKPWMLVEERPNQPFRRIAIEQYEEIIELERQLQTLKNRVESLERRKSLRVANWIGERLRAFSSVIRRS